MSRFSILPRLDRSLLGVLAVALLVGCGENLEDAGSTAVVEGPDTLPESVRAPEVEGGIVIVTPAEVRDWRAAGEPVVVVDARDPVQFRQEHIPGAVNVPYVEIRAGAALPPRDARVVVYCSDENCPISQYAYEGLSQLGYTNLYDMREGLQGWKAEGFPTEVAEGTGSAGGSDTSASGT